MVEKAVATAEVVFVKGGAEDGEFFGFARLTSDQSMIWFGSRGHVVLSSSVAGVDTRTQGEHFGLKFVLLPGPKVKDKISIFRITGEMSRDANGKLVFPRASIWCLLTEWEKAQKEAANLAHFRKEAEEKIERELIEAVEKEQAKEMERMRLDPQNPGEAIASGIWKEFVDPDPTKRNSRQRIFHRVFTDEKGKEKKVSRTFVTRPPAKKSTTSKHSRSRVAIA